MPYNHIVNRLKRWCRDKGEVYQTAYGAHGGVMYVGAQAAYELEFKLSALIDRPFDCPEDLRKAVMELLDVHYEPSLTQPPSSVAQYIIDKINGEFSEYMEEAFTQRDALPLADVPYTRVILGAEADALRERFRSVWGYVNTAYWYPLMGEEPKEVSDKFFVMFHYLEPYMKQLEQIMGLPQAHLYCYGECDFRPQHCLETVEFAAYGGEEMIFTDRDFSWAVYFSHEDTVAFAGAIVPRVKELLWKEKAHWNKLEWSL